MERTAGTVVGNEPFATELPTPSLIWENRGIAISILSQSFSSKGLAERRPQIHLAIDGRTVSVRLAEQGPALLCDGRTQEGDDSVPGHPRSGGASLAPSESHVSVKARDGVSCVIEESRRLCELRKGIRSHRRAVECTRGDAQKRPID